MLIIRKSIFHKLVPYYLTKQDSEFYHLIPQILKSNEIMITFDVLRSLQINNLINIMSDNDKNYYHLKCLSALPQFFMKSPLNLRIICLYLFSCIPSIVHENRSFCNLTVILIEFLNKNSFLFTLTPSNLFFILKIILKIFDKFLFIEFSCENMLDVIFEKDFNVNEFELSSFDRFFMKMKVESGKCSKSDICMQNKFDIDYTNFLEKNIQTELYCSVLFNNQIMFIDSLFISMKLIPLKFQPDFLFVLYSLITSKFFKIKFKSSKFQIFDKIILKFLLSIFNFMYTYSNLKIKKSSSNIINIRISAIIAQSEKRQQNSKKFIFQSIIKRY